MLTFKHMHFSQVKIIRCSGDENDIVRASPKERADQIGFLFIRGGFECMMDTPTMKVGETIGVDVESDFVEDVFDPARLAGLTEEELDDFSKEEYRCTSGSQWVCVSNYPGETATVKSLKVDGEFSIPAGHSVFVADGEIILEDKYAPIDSYFKPRSLPMLGLGTGTLLLIK